MAIQKKIEFRLLSSLSKVFPDEGLKDKAVTSGTALGGEVFSFQLAVWTPIRLRGVSVNAKSELAEHISIRSVGLAPSELPFIFYDQGMCRKTPGLYPDPLLPISKTDEHALTFFPGQWRSLWTSVRIPKNLKAKTYPIELQLVHEKKIIAKAVFKLTVLAATLPKQTLIQTQWFHADCLANYYKVPVLSKAWWDLVGEYMKNAADHGINMILTPLFTPPLDTKVGGERLTVQLVGVKKNGAAYTFDFSELKTWCDLANSSGIEYLEMSHLFTQWGAGFAPKIAVNENGVEKKMFGWHTPAMDKPYTDFLSQFLPALVSFIDREGLRKKVYFHVSDEPGLAHLEAYRKASEFLDRFLSGFPVIDALSNFEFYKTGLVKKPVPSNNHIEDFVKGGVPELWTYYCVSQWEKVPNRFFNMPSSRCRVLGFILYKYRCQGFLHWGFNFWNSQYSLRALDPFQSTDADGGFPSGDSFLVYPGEKTPIDSLRHEVHREAMQDLRALELLEKSVGREKVLSILEKGLKKPLSMVNYPRDAAWLLSTRHRINLSLEKR